MVNIEDEVYLSLNLNHLSILLVFNALYVYFMFYTRIFQHFSRKFFIIPFVVWRKVYMFWLYSSEMLVLVILETFNFSYFG